METMGVNWQTAVFLFVMVAAICGRDSEFAGEYPKDFDCSMRAFALEFAQHIQPNLSQDQLQEICDALNGSPEQQHCNISIDALPTNKPKHKHRSPPEWIDQGYNITHTVYVDPNQGNDDGNDGCLDKPFATISKALNTIRRMKHNTFNDDWYRIALREGRHYLPHTIDFEHKDSFLIITNYEHESAEISGAIPLDNVHWTPYKNKDNYVIYQANIPHNISHFDGLRVNGVRAIRARYPNVESMETYPPGFGSSIVAQTYLPRIYGKSPLPETVYIPNEWKRNDSHGDAFMYYTLGIGGDSCFNFEPNAAYWCAPNGYEEGGGAVTYTIGTGLVFNNTNQSLIHTPYKHYPTDAIINVWRPDHWATWMFNISSYKYYANNNTGQIIYDSGGFQGARGCDDPWGTDYGCGAEFFIENVFDELDHPNEWFFNRTTRILYYALNTSDDTDINDVVFEVTNLKTLFNYTGNETHPITNHVIHGITFRDTALTYLEPHGIPSGGDWALQKIGAIILYGTENFTISNNLFTRLDGIGISINRYNRNHSIIFNECVWNGETFIAAWGDTNGIEFEDIYPYTTMGYDGFTHKVQPRFLNISFNYVHELGIFEKQSSFYFQAKSCQNYISGNIFFNGPRAGINYNDGFGGGSVIEKNLLFNTCRESGDHGPFNSWDRQVYVTDVKDGTPSVIKEYDQIRRNFFIANYNSNQAVDNDDGSCFYRTHHNFFVYGLQSSLKSDFSGHDNVHYNNIIAYIKGSCFGICDQLKGFNDGFYNNTCIINSNNTIKYGAFSCKQPQSNWPMLYNNTVYALGSDIDKVGLCGLSEIDFQNKFGTDYGTVINAYPDHNDIIRQAKQMLFVQTFP
eukprot:519321_1